MILACFLLCEVYLVNEAGSDPHLVSSHLCLVLVMRILRIRRCGLLLNFEMIM